MKPSLTDYVKFLIHLISGDRLNHEKMLADLRDEDVMPCLDTSAVRILDLANGRLRPQFELLRSRGHQVFGIDLANGSGRGVSEVGYRLARWIYTQYVGRVKHRTHSPDLVGGDVGALPYASETFDLVTSIAAFEHFLSVPKVISEINRVLRDGGLVWALIHPFTSLSGGHNLSLLEVPLRHVPAAVDPWDHLRKRNLPFHVPLNQWRIDDYLEAFSTEFIILKKYCAIREGEEFLTPEIRAELSDYKIGELTCGAFVILAQKPR